MICRFSIAELATLGQAWAREVWHDSYDATMCYGVANLQCELLVRKCKRLIRAARIVALGLVEYGYRGER